MPGVSLTSLCLPPSGPGSLSAACLGNFELQCLFLSLVSFSKAQLASLYLNSYFLPDLSVSFLMPRMGKGPEEKCNTWKVRHTLMPFPSLQVLVPQVLAASETEAFEQISLTYNLAYLVDFDWIIGLLQVSPL